mmetsp:Transcript_35792/g.115100  ORF Transcript_35792/g.115100 Transcript_35792/m.115100 type:complete len:126 (+) Transcript_35792:40-417(+)
MLRILLLCICALLAQAYLPTALPASKVAARTSPVEMGARRPVKKAAAKKPVARKASGTKGKGGILPWVTNEPGSESPLASRPFLLPQLPSMRARRCRGRLRSRPSRGGPTCLPSPSPSSLQPTPR